MAARANGEQASWAEAYALLAQTLLEAPRRNEPALYDAAIWETFPCGESFDEVGNAVASVVMACPADDDGLRAVSADYTHLFVGPPKPASMPWQTMHANPNATSLSGTPTAEVRRTLNELGLQRDEENGQLEDHIGNILMVAAVMAQRGLHEQRREFVSAHVLSWIDDLSFSVEANSSTDFYPAILALAKAVAEADAASSL